MKKNPIRKKIWVITIWVQVSNWKNNFLSQANKEVQLKYAVQAIPTYAMSMFLFLQKICKEIASSISKLWWGHMKKESRIHWRKWKLFRETMS